MRLAEGPHGDGGRARAARARGRVAWLPELLRINRNSGNFWGFLRISIQIFMFCMFAKRWKNSSKVKTKVITTESAGFKNLSGMLGRWLRMGKIAQKKAKLRKRDSCGKGNLRNKKKSGTQNKRKKKKTNFVDNPIFRIWFWRSLLKLQA